MKVLSYVKNGKDNEHKIVYSIEDKILSFGANEEVKPSFQNVLSSVAEVCSKIAGFTVEIKKIEFKTPDINKFAVSVECIAAAQNGDLMKIKLPNLEWNVGYSFNDIIQQNQKVIVPRSNGLDKSDIDSFYDLEKELIDYVKDGSGQLDLEFESGVMQELSETMEYSDPNNEIEPDLDEEDDQE